ncbi:MAG: C25 family peptidase propeptide domain-containing protein, partial [Thermoplasmatota archaeon]
MRKGENKKIFLGRAKIGVVICVLMLTASFATAIGTIQTKNLVGTKNNVINSLNYSFLFKQPTFDLRQIDNSEYTLIEMPGCITMAKTSGQPALPVHFATILLPPKTDVISIDVVGTQEPIDISGINLNQKPVLPYQHSVPFDCTVPQEFEKDMSIYSSNAVYPSNLNSEYSVGYSRGYAILNFGLYPIQYNPCEGTLTYYSEIKVTINLRETGYVNEFFRNDPDDKAWVEKLVYNPEITDMYTADLPTFDYPGGLCDPSESYDYVIITTTYNGLDYWETSSTLPYNWQSLMDKHLSNDGLRCTLVTVQDIYACSDYWNSAPLFNDTQAKIREFCKDAYMDWGTDYILIAGDGESNWIPARDMDTN